ncbi:MAG: RluA family pseudouridine synthase [Solobacterium sp.]|nr:RluA family pseudouridine synthase [Erysipelotrichaceae bacterium]MCI6701609.1 RluA family pseudouridine synthase [Solobacterium sp.]MCI7732857.1 RluA family pseudouridine synthase [Solobacterium sp.]MDD6498370.1 RluA family pseudouridine synthase [Solobacterium sp.]MDD6834265.1 RluA family pseudouridine synthase [Solobacterium sp.]
MARLEIKVNEEDKGLRIDSFLANSSDLSRSQIQKLIEEGRVLVNNETTVSRYKVNPGDFITAEYLEQTPTDIKPKDIALDIVYEDEDLIVINKPKGLVVHPAAGNYDNTLVNALLYHCKELSDINGYYRPGIVHRIDKDTSGLLVCAKNNAAHAALSAQLQDKTCFRKYYAIVNGIIDNNEGIINAPIGRSSKDRQKMEVTDKNSKEAITEFKVLQRLSSTCLVECELKTGRTHQIRVHMAFIKHPVLNDPKYSKKTIDETGQYLHAYYLSFIHPKTNERMEFVTDMPEYMKNYIRENGGKID